MVERIWYPPGRRRIATALLLLSASVSYRTDAFSTARVASSCRSRTIGTSTSTTTGTYSIRTQRWVTRDEQPVPPPPPHVPDPRTISPTPVDTSSSSSSSNSQNNSNSKNNNKTSIKAGDAGAQRQKKRKMDIMWCGKDYCKDSVRERVVGEHNQIMLNGPATAQVAYFWHDEYDDFNKNNNNNVLDNTKVNGGIPKRTQEASVLVLIKPGDEELLKVAADAVMELTSTLPRVQILLDPSTAARLKHYHGVESDQIHLFEATPTPGFGANLRPSDMEEELVEPWLRPETDLPKLTPHSPDLICTIGGDGLLMHAGMMFQGPSPPILCVSGGSLGFLTPFSRNDMVEAVRIALGLVLMEESTSTTAGSSSSSTDNVFPPNMASYPYEPLAVQHPEKKTPHFAFGLGGRICLSIRMRLECRIINREGVVRARYNVLNEVVIDRGSSPYLAALECFCDDVHLTTVQADGVIFATPTGSTAYSMAAGGSVVHPAVPCILVTPICPHVLSFRSMIFPDHVVLDVFVPDDARAEASVAFDGKHRTELRRGDSVRIQMSAYPVPTVNRVDHSSDWLDSLKRNFNFNTRPRQKPL